MQSYPYKVQESKDLAMQQAKAKIWLTPNGIEYNQDGCSFIEVTCHDERTGKDRNMIMAEFPDGAGGSKFDMMALPNWLVQGDNAQAVRGFANHVRQTQKIREGNKAKELTDKVAALKGCNLSATALTAALVAEGYSKADIESAVKANAQ